MNIKRGEIQQCVIECVFFLFFSPVEDLAQKAVIPSDENVAAA